VSETDPWVGSSSALWETPGGATVSITFGTVPGSTEQIGLAAPLTQTPKLKPWGVAVKARAWSGLKPSCPVRVTVNTQPEPTVPNAERGSTSVAVPCGWSTNSWPLPSDPPDGSSHTTDANPCASSRSLHASAAAIA
jgi:hypothetical protein